jgi:metal-responsive CopG/Arc/MetJ family transcriptional regulator
MKKTEPRCNVNISLSVDLLGRLNKICDDMGISRSRFLSKGAELLLIDIENKETLDYVRN